MKPLEFLADVLPSPGHGLYCVCELSSRRKEHFFTEDVTEGRPHIKRWVLANRDVYFALATFDPSVRDRTKDRRTAINAR